MVRCSFVNFTIGFDSSLVQGVWSLDVSNLYGLIPLDTHQKQNELYKLAGNNFEIPVRLHLPSDSLTIIEYQANGHDSMIWAVTARQHLTGLVFYNCSATVLWSRYLLTITIPRHTCPNEPRVLTTLCVIRIHSRCIMMARSGEAFRWEKINYHNCSKR